MTTALRRARVRVPASTSNLGAGFDALGLALDRYLTATFEPVAGGQQLPRVEPSAPSERSRPTPAVEVDRRGTLADLPDGTDLVSGSFVAALAAAGIRGGGGALTVDSAIPVGRGLGSSAAARVAGLALGRAAAGAPLDPDAIFRDACAGEGHPDNAAPAVFGGLRAIAPTADGFRVFGLPLSTALGFVFAAPDAELRTADARRALPAQVPHALAVRNAARTLALARGLATADRELLRIGFDDELHVPHRLPLIPRGAEALAAAVQAGAFAATVSGSGSGLIAACAPDRRTSVLSAMVDALGEGATGFEATPDLAGLVVEEW